MPIPIWAIAYRSVQSDEVEKQIGSWETVPDKDGGASSTQVLCPKCGEPYILVEGINATGEILQDDREFLAKALSTGHPSHPAHMVIRDPDGVLNRHCILQSMTAAGKVNEQAAGSAAPALAVTKG